ncbi:Murein DD-endopeptidase MepM and murein hydrolase activator NlpD, contain LysM domain [Agrococcus baldri]|uniref:Murein DD-endopeptidase MepM and murein hydrolase activator NlpD, contain LysM domain n=1 Tax=Agrococcus baldri TaxID=153730 RepID=A0AA94HLF4_9MICO|nr:M23 family metallopeptidase [Agrococcus baldri]SFS03930.1 Murein DD-endopeptidase MepM and murein hydrolase activator NlpD, contain LysM domain [Agrococcus baldri]
MALPDRQTRAERAPSRGRRLRLGIAASLAVGAMLATLVTPGVPSAQAVDEYGFPTWAEVEAARGNVTAKNQQISDIRALIAQLETDAADAQALSDQRAAEAIEAQRVYDEAVAVAERLQEQADEATERAEQSQLAAGQLAAQLARSGGTGDMSAELFANPGSADTWLYRLDMIDRVAGTADTLYEQAQQDANTAQSLQDQAAVARDALQELKEAADAALVAAQEAAAAAQAAVVAQQEHRVELEAQLEVLIENRAATEDDYQAGQRHRAWLAEQERQRRIREAAQREAARQAAIAEQQRLAEEAARNNAGSGGGGSGGGTTVPVTPPASSGWVTPHYGRFTSGYGWRNDPVGTLGRKLHAGIDIAAGCGTPIYAVAAGTVTLRSYDIYGANMLYINHGGGVQSEYFHMIRPAHVYPGQRVRAGQVVAYEGSTGHSTGCHLHFQLRVGGTLTNPESFLNARGVRLR